MLDDKGGQSVSLANRHPYPPRITYVTSSQGHLYSETTFRSSSAKVPRFSVSERHRSRASKLLGTLRAKVPAASSDYQHPNLTSFPIHSARIMVASAMSGRLTLSDPSVKELAKASCVHERYYDDLPKLQGEANWQKWSDALQHAALMAAADTVLNGESKHPKSLEGKQCTTSEWNDNNKRTAIWRSRNESLLKAMRGAADVDFDDFGASNAHDSYVGLRSKYHTTDNQRAFRLFSENLVVECKLDNSPKEIAYELQDAFDQYNQLVGNSIEQRLPENFLKMPFLDSLDHEYGEWCTALLRDREVLTLDQISGLTFDELVDLVVVERTRLLQELTDSQAFTNTYSQQPGKRNISQVEKDSQSALPLGCSVPHHSTPQDPHTNRDCLVQNPRLRPDHWQPTPQDIGYLAEHPDIEDPQQSDRFSNRSENGSASMSESDLESYSEDEAVYGQETSASGRDDNSTSVQDDTSREKNLNDRNIQHRPTVDGSWARSAAARYAEVQAQVDLVTKSAPKLSPRPGQIHGTWLLYPKDHVSDTADHCYIQFWKPKKGDKEKKGRNYEGNLTIGTHGQLKTFRIPSFTSPLRVKSRPMALQLTWPGGQPYKWELTFWGNGKMLVNLPPPLLDVTDHNVPWFEFAGIQSNGFINRSSTGIQASMGPIDESTDDEAGAAAPSLPRLRANRVGRAEAVDEYDRVIRTEPRPSMVKVEKQDLDATTDDNDLDFTAITIKAEESLPNDPKDSEWVDDMTTIIDTVQKQENLVNQGLTVILHDIGGEWRFHSSRHYPGLDGRISLSFSIRQNHDIPDQMCAPGHCKTMPRHSDRYPKRIH
jgi:hypothetical protein